MEMDLISPGIPQGPDVVDLRFRDRPLDSKRDHAISEEFYECRRVNVSNFMEPNSAEKLYHELSTQTEWSTYFTSDGRKYQAPADAQRNYSTDQQRELVGLAYQSARNGGTAYLYDEGHPTYSEETTPTPISLFNKLVNGPRFREKLRFSSRGDAIVRVDARAFRLRARHFVSLRARPILESHPDRCVAWYSYNLTPVWKAEWGGALEFRGKHAGDIAGYAPAFNCLTIAGCPQAHWFNAVSEAAYGNVYMIMGGIYA